MGQAAPTACVPEDPGGAPGSVAVSSNSSATISHPAESLKKSQRLHDLHVKFKHTLEEYGPDHVLVADALLKLGRAHRLSDGPQHTKASHGFLQRAVSLLEAKPVSGHNMPHPQCLLAEALTESAAVHAELGERDAQQDMLERALALYEQHKGKDSPEASSTHAVIGVACGEAGENDAQLLHLQTALTRLEKAYGRSHPKVAACLANLTIAHGAGGSRRQQIEYFDRSALAKEFNYSLSHPELPGQSGDLRDVQMKWKLEDVESRTEAAEAELEKKEDQHGADHPEVAEACLELGCLYTRLGEATSALPLLERAARARLGRASSVNHREAARLYAFLAAAYGEVWNSGRQVEALERMLVIVEQELGSDHVLVNRTRKALTSLRPSQPDAEEVNTPARAANRSSAETRPPPSTPSTTTPRSPPVSSPGRGRQTPAASQVVAQRVAEIEAKIASSQQTPRASPRPQVSARGASSSGSTRAAPSNQDEEEEEDEKDEDEEDDPAEQSQQKPGQDLGGYGMRSLRVPSILDQEFEIVNEKPQATPRVVSDRYKRWLETQWMREHGQEDEVLIVPPPTVQLAEEGAEQYGYSDHSLDNDEGTGLAPPPNSTRWHVRNKDHRDGSQDSRSSSSSSDRGEKLPRRNSRTSGGNALPFLSLGERLRGLPQGGQANSQGSWSPSSSSSSRSTASFGRSPQARFHDDEVRSVVSFGEPSGIFEGERCDADGRGLFQASASRSTWKYDPVNKLHTYARAAPSLDAEKTARKVLPGYVFDVSEERAGSNGVTYLKMANGNGWLFDYKPGVGVMAIRQSPAPDAASSKEGARDALGGAGPGGGRPVHGVVRQRVAEFGDCLPPSKNPNSAFKHAAAGPNRKAAPAVPLLPLGNLAERLQAMAEAKAKELEVDELLSARSLEEPHSQVADAGKQKEACETPMASCQRLEEENRWYTEALKSKEVSEIPAGTIKLPEQECKGLVEAVESKETEMSVVTIQRLEEESRRPLLQPEGQEQSEYQDSLGSSEGFDLVAGISAAKGGGSTGVLRAASARGMPKGRRVTPVGSDDSTSCDSGGAGRPGSEPERSAARAVVPGAAWAQARQPRMSNYSGLPAKLPRHGTFTIVPMTKEEERQCSIGLPCLSGLPK